jgi:hypothetical protein
VLLKGLYEIYDEFYISQSISDHWKAKDYMERGDIQNKVGNKWTQIQEENLMGGKALS